MKNVIGNKILFYLPKMTFINLNVYFIGLQPTYIFTTQTERVKNSCLENIVDDALFFAV